MTTTGWMIMLLVTGFIWGGFLLLLAKALRSEAGKARDGEP